GGGHAGQVGELACIQPVFSGGAGATSRPPAPRAGPLWRGARRSDIVRRGGTLMKHLSFAAALAALALALPALAAEDVVIGLELQLPPRAAPPAGQLIRRGAELAVE